MPADQTRAQCAWGDDVRPECRTTGGCYQQHWQITAPTAGTCSDPPLPADCPGKPPDNGTACPRVSQCSYQDGTICVCSGCARGTEYPVCQPTPAPEWWCNTKAAGCPYPLPNPGEPCQKEGLSCGPSCEQPIECREGSWFWGAGLCPICASPETPIATPSGDRAIAELVPGDLVYSTDDGAIVVVPVLRVGRTRVHDHHVLRMHLDNGTTLEISPGHPTRSGEPLGSLRAGELLDELHRIESVELIPYAYDYTYDILPASRSGAYFAGGALIGSTLAR